MKVNKSKRNEMGERIDPGSGRKGKLVNRKSEDMKSFCSYKRQKRKAFVGRCWKLR